MMTTLILSMVRGPAGVEKQTRYVSSGRYEVGRSPTNDWVLEDPLCLVSKQHCVFRQDSDGWSIVDLSRNGSFLARDTRSIRLGGEPHRLKAGERLRLGQYEIAIDMEEDEASFRTFRSDFTAEAHLPPPPDIPAAVLRPEVFPTRQDEATVAIPRLTAPSDALAALLEGASLARDDVRAPGREREVFREVGMILRAAVGELRRMRSGLPGEPGGDFRRRTQTGAGQPSASVTGAASERDALRWLLDPDRTFAEPGDAAIGALFEEIRTHQENLGQAARRAMRAMVDRLDPDGPERRMERHWLDVLPGWRRRRGLALARRRYHDMRAQLDWVVDDMLAQAYGATQRDPTGGWGAR